PLVLVGSVRAPHRVRGLRGHVGPGRVPGAARRPQVPRLLSPGRRAARRDGPAPERPRSGPTGGRDGGAHPPGRRLDLSRSPCPLRGGKLSTPWASTTAGTSARSG